MTAQAHAEQGLAAHDERKAVAGEKALDTNRQNPRSSSKNGREVGVSLSLSLNDGVLEAIAQRAAELVLERMHNGVTHCQASRFVTIPEAAELLRCKRQRVDDLLSQRRLTRFKEGGRTLLDRAEVEALVRVDRVARPLPTGAAGRMARGVAG